MLVSPQNGDGCRHGTPCWQQERIVPLVAWKDKTLLRSSHLVQRPQSEARCEFESVTLCHQLARGVLTTCAYCCRTRCGIAAANQERARAREADVSEVIIKIRGRSPITVQWQALAHFRERHTSHIWRDNRELWQGVACRI
jgi:hypothetical protein